ncbi:hypothetical protein [Janthinobacterium sp.]|uniref:hypothetical protein n=1 Tax=Janthinobacterium sp. TaxID=1871054 RepID=UPI0025BDD891|nr:hypothetical protein [Janthinobacterium sp.]NBV20308.1 hypothetical protein [Janthinobacterium sp.]
MLDLAPAIVHLVADMAKAVGPRSDGGKKVTKAEAEQLRDDALALAFALAQMLTAHDGGKR